MHGSHYWQALCTIMREGAMRFVSLQDQIKDMVQQRITSVPAQDLPVLLLYLIKSATQADVRKVSSLPCDTHATRGNHGGDDTSVFPCRWCS